MPSSPNAEARREMFNALVTNGLGFIRRSAEELKSDKAMSVAHFATGVELLLKARLFHEHWSLIAENPHSCRWTEIRNGSVKTIRASDLCKTLTTLTEHSLQKEQDVFKQVFEHRNRVLHWIPGDDLASVTAEQCRAWHALFRLLTTKWPQVFHAFQDDIRRVEKTLRVHQEYLQARFEAIERSGLRGPMQQGRVVECPSCHLLSAVLEEPSAHASLFRCDVCESTGHLARFECGNQILVIELPSDCECGNRHTGDELAKLADPNEDDRPHCGSCQAYESLVITLGNEYLCLDCGESFECRSRGSCEWCSEDWVGCDLEDSYYSGCGFCDGRVKDAVDRDD